MTEPLPPPQSPYVTVWLDPEEAESLSLSLSDLLCWQDGFNAARAGTDLAGTGPMGIEAVRTLNIKIKSAIDAREANK